MQPLFSPTTADQNFAPRQDKDGELFKITTLPCQALYSSNEHKI